MSTEVTERFDILDKPGGKVEGRVYRYKGGDWGAAQAGGHLFEFATKAEAFRLFDLPLVFDSRYGRWHLAPEVQARVQRMKPRRSFGQLVWSAS